MLESLIAYAERAGLVVEPGFCDKPVHWLAHIDTRGRVLAVNPASSGSSKQRIFSGCPDLQQPDLLRLPQTLCRLIEGARVTQAAHFLADACSTVALFPSGQDIDAKLLEKHRAFKLLLTYASKTVNELQPIAVALSRPAQIECLRDFLADRKAKPMDRLSFCLNGQPVLELPIWQDWWRSFRQKILTAQSEQTSSMICLTTGEESIPVLVHPKLTTLGAGSSSFGVSLIAFGKDAFESFGLGQGENAATSSHAAAAYRAALDSLLRHASTASETRLLHWYDTDIPAALDPIALLLSDWSTWKEEATVPERIQGMYNSTFVKQHIGTPSHFLVLRANSVRARVRLHLSKKLEQNVDVTQAWWTNFELAIPGGRGTTSIGPCQALESLQKSQGGEVIASDITSQQSLLVAFWQTVFDPAIAFPNAMIVQAIHVIHNSVMTRDFLRALTGHDHSSQILHARVAWLKAHLKRSGDTQIQPALNPSHSSCHYQVGRFNALLERIQMMASAKQRDRAMIPAFGRSIYQSAITLEPMTRGIRYNLEQIVMSHPAIAFALEAELEHIWEKLSRQVPQNTSVKEQALFILGYYQQSVFNQAHRQTERNLVLDVLEASISNEDQFMIPAVDAEHISENVIDGECT